MKTKFVFLLILSIGFLTTANAQFVNQQPISEIDADYVRLWSDSGPLLSSKVTVRIDWGQGGRTPQITDDRRRVLSFNGMMEVLNMMSKDGFELVEIMTTSGVETEVYYMRRRVSRWIERGANSSDAVEYNPDIHSR